MQFQLPLSSPPPPVGLLVPETLVVPAEVGFTDAETLSEITLSGASGLCLHLLAPVLRDLSENSDARWLTLIAPPTSLSRTWLRDAGLNRERILLLQPSGNQAALQLACDALSLGRSHTVVTWFDKLSRSERRQLSLAALAGNAQGLNIKMNY
ncbi:SOS-induced cell division inhibitor SulA [Pseudomonas sp. Marseille-QA0892]